MRDARATELIRRAESFRGKVAIVDGGNPFSYDELLLKSERVARGLLGEAGDLNGARVAFLVRPGFDHVAVQWGIWRAGGVAVPLAPSHPTPELEYVIGDSDAAIVIADADLQDRVSGIAAAEGLSLALPDDLLDRGRQDRALPEVDSKRRAMILYTSGTTSRPKGVVTTHGNIQAQIEALVAAWEWSADDHILLVLPLHHVHGIVNVVGCALWSGAKVTMHDGFDAEATWTELAAGELTLFMAVPTVYSRLIAAWDGSDAERRRSLSEGCRHCRLMVSGSAALPVSTLERWRSISGHTLLERYGMTEIGMALSNPLDGERRPGYVGIPLPEVVVRLVGDDGRPAEPGEPGEIEVRGPAVFGEYWRKPEATRDAFRDGWFRTGDVAVVENGYYRILGRNSVDILKTGGYKVSALEVEEVLRTHPAVAECAVVGLPDDEWGDRVAVALVLRQGTNLSAKSLQAWGKERLAPYKLPREVRIVASLPRNAMGKVTKAEVKRLFA
jgi:malonyl-CoA/methylmalonyl-CoA synthetase